MKALTAEYIQNNLNHFYKSKMDSSTNTKILILGLDCGGKTSILYRLRLGEVVNTVPTIGFNVETLEHEQRKYAVWDVGGQDKIRVLWRHYYSEIKGLIFVVDSSNFDRLDQAREVLHQILLDKELEDAVLLVYANKCDIAVASVAAIQEKLELNEIKNRKWYIQLGSALTGEGLQEGFNWLCRKVSEIAPLPTIGYTPVEVKAIAKKEGQLLIVGLDNAGKTTILYKLKLGEVVATVLTLGFNVETIESESVKYNVWDVGGSGNIRGLWSHYYENVQGLIFVVDSSEPERLEEATNEINKLLVEEALKDTVLLVYANKFDIGVLTLGELSDKLGLPALQDRVWQIQPCSATTGDGLSEGFKWLDDKISSTLKEGPPVNKEIDEGKTTENVKQEGTKQFPEVRLLMVGLDGVGKTSILYRIKLGEVLSTVPTVGFNVETIEHKSLKFTIWDVGGQQKIRLLWRHYLANTQGLIFVVDSSDKERLGDAAKELNKLLDEEELKDTVLLVYANKFDIGSLTLEDITIALGLQQLRNRKWYIQASSSKTADGLMEGFDWLAKSILVNLRPIDKPTEDTDAVEGDKTENPEDTDDKTEFRALMLGLDGSGKTSILYHAKLGEPISSIPTIGFNVETLEFPNHKCTIWDVGGQKKIRCLWHHYYANTKVFIFVVDSSQPQLLDEAREELYKALQYEELKDSNLLIFANKQDRPEAISIPEITERLGLNSLQGRQWYIQGTSVLEGKGIAEGFQWACSKIATKD